MPDKMQIHKDLCDSMHTLYMKKNADYGDSFSQLRKRYPNFVCMRLFDKLNRLDTIMTPGHKLQLPEEKIEDTLMDIANYCIMELTERRAEGHTPKAGTGGHGHSVSEKPTVREVKVPVEHKRAAVDQLKNTTDENIDYLIMKIFEED